MEQKLVLRGLLAGALAGLLAFVFARIFVGPVIQSAVDYEGGREAAQSTLEDTAGHQHGVEEGAELFSRGVQQNLGAGLAQVVFGLAMGGVLAAVFCLAQRRASGVRTRVLALLAAGAGLLGVCLVPFVKYPANPPGIGLAGTIEARTSMYLLMVAISLAVLASAVWLGWKLVPRLGTWSACLVAGAAFVIVIGVAMAVLPSFEETPLPFQNVDGSVAYPGFPAGVLADFRLYSIATQIVLWSALGLVFGVLAERAGSRARGPSIDRAAIGV